MINHVNANSKTTSYIKDSEGNFLRDSKGKRISVTLSKVTGTPKEVGKAKVAAAMTILNAGLSWIYYGDEIGRSSNTDLHIDKYGNPTNEDLWYRQPFKWGNDDVTPGYQFGNYKIEWDNTNKTLPSLPNQKKDKTSMLSYYKELCDIKNQFGTSQRFVGKNSGTADVVYWQVTGDNGTFNVYINTSSSLKSISASGTLVGYASANGTACSKTSIQPYSAVVTKS